MFLPQEILRKKRDGQELTAAEIREFVHGVLDGSVNQGQIGAFTMATYLKGMSIAESLALTLAMRDSGTVLNWQPCLPSGAKIIEKHSSGGVGDEKVTLLVTPLVAACGVFAPNISGRSLGHTGGELDLLESIPGYRIEPSTEDFIKTVQQVGTAIIGPTADLAPADRAIFHVRDITATVESIPLIVSSILSKKLATGAQAMVMTVPFGTGAFMHSVQDAARLAEGLIEVAHAAGLPMVALISDLDQVLGDSVGNALQIREVIEFLRGTRQEARLREVVLTLATEIVLLADKAPSREAAAALVAARLTNGSAAERFGAMVAALGGPADLLQNPERSLQSAPVVAPVFPAATGIVQRMDCWQIGMALVALGAGRAHPEDSIDYAVGIDEVTHVGDSVGPGRPLCRLHARNPEQWQRAAETIQEAFEIGTSPVPLTAVFHQRFQAH